ncbi:MAG: hypothetical protein KKG04_05355 [Candidatus Thermoplasmatota archaeon]|nr:hypothetical protein [Candidatus Thermoplasmatota archaeon]
MPETKKDLPDDEDMHQHKKNKSKPLMIYPVNNPLNLYMINTNLHPYKLRPIKCKKMV